MFEYLRDFLSRCPRVADRKIPPTWIKIIGEFNQTNRYNLQDECLQYVERLKAKK